MTEPSAPAGSPETAASLNLEINTGDALATLVSINAELDKLSITRAVDRKSVV